MDDKTWYVVYTKPRQEMCAEAHLSRQGYSVYLPCLNVRKKNTDYSSVREPAFPRYLFIALNTYSDNWSPIRSTRGVVSFVRFGVFPARVPSELIDLLQIQEEQGTLCLPEVKFNKGDKVLILEGILAGYEAIFEAHQGAVRAQVLIALADRYTKVTLPLDGVASCHSKARCS